MIIVQHDFRTCGRLEGGDDLGLSPAMASATLAPSALTDPT